MTLSDPVLLALIGAFTAGVMGLSGYFQSWLTARNLRREKVEDYARQDAVAKAAKDAIDAAKTATEKVADKLEKSAAATNEKLETIHVLVNSNMTAAMQSELDAITREHAIMLELIALKKAAGSDPSIEALAAVKATKEKINQLQADINGRLNQASVVEAKIRKDKP